MRARVCLVICLYTLFAGGAARAGDWPPDYLRKPAKAADIGQVPALRVLDASGTVRWRLPVVLWRYPARDLGGFYYPVGVSPDKPLSLRGPLVFVGYGLTREGWDDYLGRRIDGGIAVMFTGTPQTGASADHSDTTDLEAWTRLIQEKVTNAQAHGAVGVWMERNPLAPAEAGGIGFHPKRAPSLGGGGVAAQLPLPVFSIGTDTLELVVGLSSDLYGGHNTPGNIGLTKLLKEAETEGKGLGPIPLALSGDLSWNRAQLERREGVSCSVWYQPGSPAARDIDAVVITCDNALRDLESLLSARVERRTTVLLFGDWRSKFYCTLHIGWGAGGDGHMAMVYEGKEEDTATLVHELCHVVAGSIGSPPACFDEGLAELVGDTLGDLQSVTRGRVVPDDVTEANLREGKLWTLSELLDLPNIGSLQSNPAVSYPESASFCAFLIREIGFDGFRTLYQTLERGHLPQITGTLEKATGRRLDQLEADWHTYLREMGG